ncbi:MAG: PKD domain-containing protein [Flavobacteriales bacterium]|nr:PKD domain-containing protein [Flavobacteriales bacterium]
MKFTKYILLFIVLFSFIEKGKGQEIYKTSSPNLLPGLALWLADSVEIVGGKVEKWYDLSGNDYHAKQNTVSKQPLQLLATEPLLNNQSFIRFDGVDDYFTLGDSLDPFKKDLSIFLVGKSNAILSIYISKDQYQYINGSYAIWYASDKLRFKYTDGASKEASSTENSGDYELISATTNRDIGTNSFYKSGGLISSRTGVANKTVDIDNTFPFMIGATINSTMTPVFFLNGDIAEIIIYDTLLNDSSRFLIEQYLRNKYAPPVSLGNDINVPYGFCDTLLDASNRFVNYLWNTTDTISSITVSENGTYFVETTDVFGYTSSDTVNVYYPQLLTNNTADTTMCLGDTLTFLSALNKTGYSFLWSDNSSDSLLKVTSPGDYWVRVTDSLGCFQYSDTITVAVDSFSVQTSLGPDKTVCQGERINLIVGSGITNYLWSTNDTINQTTVDTAGTYWLQTTNINGCVAYDTVQITVNGIAPTVNFQIADTCENALISFVNNSFTTDGSNITGSLWDFGNGDTTTISNPQEFYGVAGVFDVSLQINTDSGCTNTYIKQIQIREKPTAGFFTTGSLLCSRKNVAFNDNSFSSDGILNAWNWNFGDTTSADTSSLKNPFYAYQYSGSFNVQLIATTEHGCSDTLAQFINVKPSPTASYISVGNCVNQQVQFTNTSSGSLFSTAWSFGDASSSSLNNPNHFYNVAGVYMVKLIVRELNGCYDTIQAPLTISDSPNAYFVPEDICVLSSQQFFDSSTTNIGSISSWFWDVENHANQSTDTNPTFFFNLADSGSYQLKLRVTNSFGCKDSLEQTINIHALPYPNFDFNPQIGEPPLNVDFTNLTPGVNTYQWVFGNGDTSADVSPNYTYLDSNFFNIKLIATSQYGCVDSITQSIQVIQPIVDVAVNNVSYEFLSGSNYMKINAQLANYGIVPITNIDLELNISGLGTTLEKWIGDLQPATQQTYTFSTLVEIPQGKIPDAVCVNALSPNNTSDNDESNNEFCKTLSNFELINVYPIPSSINLEVEYIVPSNDQIEISLYDNIGHQIKILYSGAAQKGMNRHSFVVSVYSQGVYVLELSYQGKKIRKKIMIK